MSCSRIVHAPECTPVLLAVVSKQQAITRSNDIFQSFKTVTVACAICCPLPRSNDGTVRSFSTPQPVTSTGSRSAWSLPLKVGSNFPSQCTVSVGGRAVE
jgi:hypothetical protein